MFLSVNAMSVRLRATGMEAVARCGVLRHAGSIRRMPCTRLTPTMKYSAPRIGQQRLPTGSSQRQRSAATVPVANHAAHRGRTAHAPSARREP